MYIIAAYPVYYFADLKSYMMWWKVLISRVKSLASSADCEAAACHVFVGIWSVEISALESDFERRLDYVRSN